MGKENDFSLSLSRATLVSGEVSDRAWTARVKFRPESDRRMTVGNNELQEALGVLAGALVELEPPVLPDESQNVTWDMSQLPHFVTGTFLGRGELPQDPSNKFNQQNSVAA